MKKIFFYPIFLSLLSSCTTAKNESSTTNNTSKIAFIASSDNSFKVNQMVENIDKIKATYKYNINVYYSEDSSTKELNNTKLAIKNKAEVLIFHFVSGENIEAIKYAKKQGKKVIVLENKIYGVDVDGFILLDHKDSAEKLAVQTQKVIKDNSKISFHVENSYYLIGSSMYPLSQTKYNNFIKKWDDFKDVEVEVGSFNEVLSNSKVQEILEVKKSVNLWVGGSPNMTLGITNSNKEEFGNKDLYYKNNKLIVGFGYNEKIKEEIENGNIFAVSTFDWGKVFEKSVMWADSLILNNFDKWKEIKKAYISDNKEIKIKSKIITKGV